MKRLLITIAIAITVGLLFAVPAAANAGPPTQGADVSHFQGAVNWSAVPPSVVFTAAKATENCRTDATFNANWQGMRATARPVRLAYVFLHQGQDPHDVVKCLADAIHKAGGPLQAGEGVALDVEATPTISVDYTLAVAVQVQIQLNRIPVVYAGCYYGHILTAKSLATYPKWLAAYRATAPCPFDVWQFSSSGTVPGIPARVDLNTLNQDTALGAMVRVTRDAVADSSSNFTTLQPADQQQVADLTAFYRAVAFRQALQLGAARALQQSASAINVRHALNGLGFAPTVPVATALRFMQGLAGLRQTGTLTPDTRNAMVFALVVRSTR